MTISRELLDELLSGVERPEDLLGDKGLLLGALYLDKPHGRSEGRFNDCCCVILLLLHKWLDINRRDETDLMAKPQCLPPQ